MNHAPVKLGPLALLLTVISICLTILSILTYTTAGADDRLAQRYAQTTTERYELEIAGQEALAEFPAGFEANAEYDNLLASQTGAEVTEETDDNLLASQTETEATGETNDNLLASPLEGGGGPEGTGEGALWKTIEQDGLILTIGATPGADGPQVVTWKVSRQWEQDGLIHNLWDGE